MPAHKTSPHVFIVLGEPGRTAIDGQHPDGSIQQRPQDKQPVFSHSLGPQGPTVPQQKGSIVWLPECALSHGESAGPCMCAPTAEVLKQLKRHVWYRRPPRHGSLAALWALPGSIPGARDCARAEGKPPFSSCLRDQTPAATPLL
ncbi:hypothetical protein AAFF_G00153330 [Aldrovandia affinis]|uniref:Uncharacterized protein n=1 Tax=Aldrovandia affinis TaxID=143900 RepID=A0AAD7SZL8_9TELE|nr:hypothetical protein AAFF_G00153330 [Aldrovandia affinis]